MKESRYFHYEEIDYNVINCPKKEKIIVFQKLYMKTIIVSEKGSYF